MDAHQYFQDCLQCLAYTEDVVKVFCRRIIDKLHTETQLELRKVLTCTLATEQDNVEVNGWPSTVLEHKCSSNPPCNTFINEFLENLPCASKLNRTEVLKAICQTEIIQFIKLFVEPWMSKLGYLWAMDAYCLFFLLDNVSFFHHDRSAGRHALYQQHIGKMRKLAESCLYEDVEDVTKTDRDMCLHAVINALAFVCENDADEAIHNIQELRCMSARNTQIKSETLARRSYLKRTINSFQQEVIQAVSDILNNTMDDKHDSSEDEEDIEGTVCPICSREHTLNTQDYEEISEYFVKRGLGPNLLEPFRKKTVRPKRLSHYQLVKSVVENSITCSGLEELFSQQIIDSLPASPHGASNVSTVNYKYAQAVVFYLENANVPNEEVRSLLDALTSPKSTSGGKDNHIATLKKAVQRQGHASSFQEIVYSETKTTYFKLCYQVMLTMEKGLRQHCKRTMKRLHNTVTVKFPRTRLCQLADKDDMVRVNDSPSAELIFKHKCKKEPECNTFLKVVFSQRSAKCIPTPQTMFTNVNPQDCIDNIWEFTKLFLEPCMHMFNGFDDLDLFCLLTLFVNVKMFNGNQREEDKFLRAVFKARDGALKALQSSKQELTQQTMESFFESIIFIMERCKFPGSDRLLKQVKEMKTGTSLPLFDIRLSIESRRQKCVKQYYDKSIIRDTNECNWFRIVLALKSLQPSLLPIIQKTMKKEHKASEYIFGRKLCIEANAEDIMRLGSTQFVIFKHSCTGISSAECNSLLNRIKYLTATSADLLSMLRGTDPQTWLRSPFDFTSIFLKDWMRHEVRNFEECDVGALFHLIKQCQPLRKMFNKDKKKEDVMKPVRGVRNRLLHCSSMETGKQEMEEAIDKLLEMLRHIEHEQVGNEVTEAIEDIGQIKRGELNLLRHEGIQLLEEVMADLKRKRIQQEHLMSMLKQNIIKIETALLIPETSNSDKMFDGQVAEVAEDRSVAEVKVKGKTSAGFLFWCRCALALKYLQLTWLPFVEKEMNALHRETLSKFRGKLCPNAKPKDIIAENDRLKFKHTCTNNCNQMLDVIQNLFPESIKIDKKRDMLQETDPQTWLSSPLEFTRLFMKKWKTSEIKKFEHCDVSALCEITKHCQSLMDKMEETMVIDVRSVRNTTVHSPTMELSQQKMEDNIDVMLTFIRYLKRNVTHLDIAEANANINMLKHGDFTLLLGNNLRLLQEFVSDMRRDVAFTQVETAELSKKVTEMETTFSTIIAEAKLPGNQFTDTGGGVSKRWNSGMAGQFDRSLVVDRSELKKKRQETKRLLEQKKEEFQKSLRETHRQLEQEKDNIQASISDIRQQTWKLETDIKEIDINIALLHKAIAKFARDLGQPHILGAVGGFVGGLFGGVVGIVGGPAGVVAGASAGASVGFTLGAATGVAMNVVGMVIDATTEEGCRDGIRRLENASRERRQKITSLERDITYQQQIHTNLLQFLNSDGSF